MFTKNHKIDKESTDIKIAFVYYSLQSFVKQDYEILSRHFVTKKANYRNIWDTFKIFFVVLRTDVSFSWFAGGHSFLAVLFCKLFRKTSVVILGGGDVADVPEIDYGGMRKHKRSRYFTKFVLEHADLLLAVSNFTKTEAEKYTDSNVMLLYNGIDVNYFNCRSNKEDIVVTIGNRYVLKGIETFIDAAKKLPHIKFVIIGKFDVEITNIPQNVLLTGFLSRNEVVDWLSKAKVYCQLSYYESFGMALSEAMACECVPVVTNMGALPEVVGDTGMYVPYGNAEETANAIKKALRMEGKLAKDKVYKSFPFQRRANELVNIIYSLYEFSKLT
ncbi:glycosyltransferase family 4 protein [Methanococcoides seepicolus]|uniref:Glycosyltransferase family 4 protein n=1 Tax=Methanococcoides seepicolus TaxID=2828780 RepID=A0A9E5DBR8_9EURY|nr:glycosyltransferase family 4 protein [Methanococcoides seepicolus]MCM1986698.1 glycosyltransferase family 4 protein [Methanococcoides seepicolus]